MGFLRLEGKHDVAKPEEGKLEKNGEVERRMQLSDLVYGMRVLSPFVVTVLTTWMLHYYGPVTSYLNFSAFLYRLSMTCPTCFMTSSDAS